MLEAEADRLCNAGRYERTAGRRDQRSGSYDRKLQTKAGAVTLKVPEAAPADVRDSDHRALSAAGEFGGGSPDRDVPGRRVSVRRVEDITEALWGTRVSPGTVSNLNKKIYGQIEAWRNQPIEGEQPYVYLDGIVLKRTWAGEVRNVSLLVAISVNAEGYRQILGIVEGAKEDKAGWSGFLAHLKGRGLRGVELIVSDACMGLVESAAEFFPEARWQRCMVGSLKKLERTDSVFPKFADGEARRAGAEGTGSAGAVHHWLAPPTHPRRSRAGSGRPRARSFLAEAGSRRLLLP